MSLHILTNVALVIGVAALATCVTYGLWWIHNDRPFVAALLVGIIFTAYDRLRW